MKLAMTGVLLAGGKSRRMGCDKAALTLGGQTLAQRGINVLTEVFAEVVFSVGPGQDRLQAPSAVPIRAIEDRVPDQGPLGALCSVLQAAKYDWIFLIACDMPFFTADGIRALAQEIGAHSQIVVPEQGGRLHPLHAFYHRSALPAAEQALQAGQRRMEAVLEACRTRIVSWEREERRLTNVNTPADCAAISGQEPSGE